MGKENRNSERKPMFEICRYTIDGREYADLSTNISEKGIFIKNTAPPPIGTPVVLTVTLPEEWGKLPMQIIGRVAWVDNGEDEHQRGMGLEFQSVFANSPPIIEYFVSKVYVQQPSENAESEGEGTDLADNSAYSYSLKNEEGEDDS